MPKIFVSYRRDDTIAIAGRIGDRLRSHYDRASVYIDVDNIPPGVDFRTHITNAVQCCDVVLVLIGDRWLTATADGRSRIHEPTDLVRIEIEAALHRDIPVIPVLVGAAQMPTDQQLPESVSQLAFRNALRVDQGPDFHYHMDRLIRSMNDHSAVQSKMTSATAIEINTIASAASVKQSTPSAEQAAPTLRYNVAAEKDILSNDGLKSVAMYPPLNLNMWQALTITVLVIVLNSILAGFGSVLWGVLHYWPAFMVCALLCAYLRFWGVAVAALSPIVSSLLLIGGAPSYLYIPANTLQALLVLAAFSLARIDPSLRKPRDVVLYLTTAVIVPSASGATTAYFLRQLAGIGSGDPPIQQYVFFWALENLLPAIFPGIWLHRVVGSLREPFSWEGGSQRRSWAGRTIEYSAPWMIVVILAGALSLVMMSSAIGHVDGTEVVWSRVHELAATNPVFAWLSLAMCIALPVAIGFAIRHARHAWQIEEAIRRHVPHKAEADRLLIGATSRQDRKVVTVAFVRMCKYTELAQSVSPVVLLRSINAFFDLVTTSAESFGGHVDYPNTDRTMIVFGVNGEEDHAESALLFACDVVRRCRKNDATQDDGKVEDLEVLVAVHTGPVLVCEMGSRDRRHFSVIGTTVETAKQISRDVRELSSGACIATSDTLNETGVAGLVSRAESGLLQSHQVLAADGKSLLVFSVASEEQLERTLSHRL